MITKKLASSPMLYMSSGSKELFHRNFLYWLGTNYRDKFQILMTRLLCIASQCLMNGYCTVSSYIWISALHTKKRKKRKIVKGRKVQRSAYLSLLRIKLIDQRNRPQFYPMACQVLYHLSCPRDFFESTARQKKTLHFSSEANYLPNCPCFTFCIQRIPLSSFRRRRQWLGVRPVSGC